MSRLNSTLTHAYLKEILYYHPSTGQFVWLVDRHRRKTCGTLAGCVSHKGYYVIRINNDGHSAHRLAWFYMYGKWPEHVIDHIDGNKLNNRIANLRDVRLAENSQNRIRANRTAKSTGVLGVTLTRSGTFRAQLRLSGEVFYLGQYKSPEEAHQVYLQRKREMHKGCTI